MPINPKFPAAQTPEARVAERLQTLERKLRNMENFLQGGATQQIPVVDITTFTPGRRGRIVIHSGDSKLYRDTGAAWVNPV